MKTITTNKAALFNYQILDRLEAGIVLSGAEVKAIKQGNINLKGAYISPREGKLWLVNAYIAPYRAARGRQTNDDLHRPRQLLLRRREIESLLGKMGKAGQGLTLLPLCVNNKKGFLKIEIGLARGKKKADKREIIKKRETDRTIRRALKFQ